MPVIRDPGTLTTGHGKAAPDENAARPTITGAGLAGAGPNIGTISDENQPSLPDQPVIESVNAHVDDPKGAHNAQSISLVGHPEILWSPHVSGAFGELIGTVMQRPPLLGEWSPHVTMSGITDWGYLKLGDGGLENYGELTFTDTTVQNDANVFPYLLQTVGPARDTATTTNEFSTIPMSDPRSDPYFNSGTETLVVHGQGWGRCHIGAYTRDGNVGPAPLPIYRTARIYPRPTGVDGTTGRPLRIPATISGVIFPADRGVLSLFHFAPDTAGDAKTAFLAQPLISDEAAPLDPQGRVVAAILLGTGLLGGKCSEYGLPCPSSNTCDGNPGGIFTVGVDSSGIYDPTAYPGRASGQYDLAEIHSGVDSAANALRSPWDDYNDSGAPGSARAATDEIPAPGQVRLGTDPSAGETPVSYGIPILGGTAASYVVAPTAQNGSRSWPIHGDALVDTNNFYRYRLPALKDYSQATGLKWTPRGEVATTTAETDRYFDIAVNSDPTFPDPYWTTAGMYPDFDDDYFTWQIARYRQAFLMPSIELDGDREEIGTYMLIHFKTEADFERCARDGEFPWAVADPYDVYGISMVEDPENVDNVANPWLAATAPVPPDGPAPLYGYNANPYHNLRSRIFMDPAGVNLPAVSTMTFDWSTLATPATEALMWVSGVAYFTPRITATGLASFYIDQCDITIGAGFWTSYRTDSTDILAATGVGLVASQNSVMVATAPWGYDPPVAGTPGSTLTVPVGAAGVGFIPSTDYQMQWRLELPYTHLGTNAGGVFTDANAPLDADTLALALPSAIELLGDRDNPSFSRDAKTRVHFRRPVNHITAPLVNLPYTAADGHGQVLTHATLGTVLMHTSLFDRTNQIGAFGNYLVGALGIPPNISYTSLSTYPKDTQERFLDETYRYTPLFLVGLDTPYGAGAYLALNGPGLQGWAGGPLECPTRISDVPFANVWAHQSWLLMELHILDQTGVNDASDSLQVAGLPDRNPAVSAVATMPYPSVGLLQYPQVDYSTGHVPVTVTHMTEVQPDYSTALGIRTYLRCLDAAFLNSPVPVDAVGQSFVTLRLDGVTLTDIGFTAPGPGGLSNTRLAIEVKVPGLTTWMDAGRQDGSGPSKQDPVMDGAGCLVVGDESYTFTDPESGYKGCYLKVHVGPTASLFASQATVATYSFSSPLGEVPVLVRVRMDSDTTRYNLEKINTGTGTFEATSKPGASPAEVRGFIGIRLVHPSDTLIAADSGGSYPLPLLP